MFDFLFIFYFWVFGSHIVLFVFFTEKLKKEFPQIYLELDKPSIVPFGGGDWSKFNKFLHKREYLNLENDLLIRLGHFTLATRVLIYIIFVSFFIRFFVP